jgi:hypothetical protein
VLVETLIYKNRLYGAYIWCVEHTMVRWRIAILH